MSGCAKVVMTTRSVVKTRQEVATVKNIKNRLKSVQLIITKRKIFTPLQIAANDLLTMNARNSTKIFCQKIVNETRHSIHEQQVPSIVLSNG